MGRGVTASVKGGGDAPILLICMLAVDDSELTRQQIEFLEEWADALNVSVEVLLGRIVVATIDGFLYTEKIPDCYPE